MLSGSVTSFGRSARGGATLACSVVCCHLALAVFGTRPVSGVGSPSDGMCNFVATAVTRAAAVANEGVSHGLYMSLPLTK